MVATAGGGGVFFLFSFCFCSLFLSNHRMGKTYVWVRLLNTCGDWKKGGKDAYKYIYIYIYEKKVKWSEEKAVLGGLRKYTHYYGETNIKEKDKRRP